jgi:hypothetical protein
MKLKHRSRKSEVETIGPYLTSTGSTHQKTFEAKNARLEPWPEWPVDDTLEGEVEHSPAVLVRDPEFHGLHELGYEDRYD